jgi:hypothetical protein
MFPHEDALPVRLRGLRFSRNDTYPWDDPGFPYVQFVSAEKYLARARFVERMGLALPE